MTGLQRHMHCAQLAKGKYMCGQQQMLSRLDMMQQASSSADIWLLREAPCVRGADINSSCHHFYKHECCTKMGALQHFLRLCGSPVVAMSKHSTTLGVACSCQSCLRSAVRPFPLLLSISTSMVPGFNSSVAVMLPCAVQSSKCRCLGTIALCCQQGQTKESDMLTTSISCVYTMLLKNLLADSASAALQRCPGLIAVCDCACFTICNALTQSE